MTEAHCAVCTFSATGSFIESQVSMRLYGNSHYQRGSWPCFPVRVSAGTRETTTSSQTYLSVCCLAPSGTCSRLCCLPLWCGSQMLLCRTTLRTLSLLLSSALTINAASESLDSWLVVSFPQELMSIAVHRYVIFPQSVCVDCSQNLVICLP